MDRLLLGCPIFGEHLLASLLIDKAKCLLPDLGSCAARIQKRVRFQLRRDGACLLRRRVRLPLFSSATSQAHTSISIAAGLGFVTNLYQEKLYQRNGERELLSREDAPDLHLAGKWRQEGQRLDYTHLASEGYFSQYAGPSPQSPCDSNLSLRRPAFLYSLSRKAVVTGLGLRSVSYCASRASLPSVSAGAMGAQEQD